jgi:sterol desaturase/sphingolipid hydroxylase (fatty acid hydroxylase superfamily)
MKELVLYVVYYDFFYYFMHRLLHTGMFYQIHKIHHYRIEPEYKDFYKVHILETPLTSIGLIFAVYLYKLYIYQLLCAIIFINVRGVMSHDKKFISLVGDHHLQHHKFFKCNYGEYWMDYLFGTLHTRK